jgi:hypothetical protein
MLKSLLLLLLRLPSPQQLLLLRPLRLPPQLLLRLPQRRLRPHPPPADAGLLPVPV